MSDSVDLGKFVILHSGPSGSAASLRLYQTLSCATPHRIFLAFRTLWIPSFRDSILADHIRFGFVPEHESDGEVPPISPNSLN